MAQIENASRKCRACRGRGWKLRRSRRSVVIGTLVRGTVPPGRYDCPECGGSGRAR